MNKLVQSYIKKYGSTFKAILALHRMVKDLKQRNSRLERSMDFLLEDERTSGVYQEDPRTIDHHYYHKHLYYYGGASDVVSLPQFIKNYDPLKYGDINTFSPKSCACLLCIEHEEGHTFNEVHDQPENRAFDAKYSRS